jgi:hypothetical protein
MQVISALFAYMHKHWTIKKIVLKKSDVNQIEINDIKFRTLIVKLMSIINYFFQATYMAVNLLLS